MMERKKESDNDDLVDFVLKGKGRIGQSIDVPSPLGRNQAGWAPISLKLNPESCLMLDQLREHPYFRGVWKTQGQVAWSMLFLGLQATTDFLDGSWDGWRKFKSNAVIVTNAAMEHNRVQREEMLYQTTRLYRRTIHTWLDRQDAFGRYQAWKVMENALVSRGICEDMSKFDHHMRSIETGFSVGTALSQDNRAGDLYSKVVPEDGGPVDEAVRAMMYTEMTVDYFLELDHERGVGVSDEEF